MGFLNLLKKIFDTEDEIEEAELFLKSLKGCGDEEEIGNEPC